MTERASCWSITINNYTEEELKPQLPAGWVFKGQPERGEQGTEHFQGMLTTPQVRFSAVKKVFPRAHIEIARNRAALAKYVNKEETRVGDPIEVKSTIPTLFDYQIIIAKKWNEEEFQQTWKNAIEVATKTFTVPDIDETAMRYLDSIVAADIESGCRGAEFIAINPMWRSSWKRFWRNIINRECAVSPEPSQQDVIVATESGWQDADTGV